MPLKPTNKEEEYFAREEALKLRKLAEKVKSEMSAAEKEELRRRHWMRCPKCGLEMKTIQINQVDVDKCFGCGGIYLDDGELEKISGRSAEFFKQMKDVLGS